MNSTNFVFTGEWEYDIELPLLSGFQERNGYYSSISSNKTNSSFFKIEFEDDLTDNQEPYPQQLNTLNFIFENQEKISNAIVERTLFEMPQIISDYGLENEEDYQNLNAEKVKLLLSISFIRIKIISKDDYSYFDISGGCNWDEEHGLNMLFHKNRIITFGGIDGSSTYEAEKDNGTFDLNHHQHFQKEKPKKYLPDPKYNKLKPSQKSANETYEYMLISYGFNDEFIKGVENGEIDMNGKYISQDKTYLEAACWFGNNQLVEYLLGKKAEIRYAMHQCVGYGNNPEALQMLLKAGADINFPYANGNTVLFEMVNSMESFYRSFDHYRKLNSSDFISPEKIAQLAELKNRIKYLIQNGANPNLKNSYGFNCFDIMRYADEQSRREVNEFLEKCWAESKHISNFSKTDSRVEEKTISLWNSLKKWFGLTGKS